MTTNHAVGHQAEKDAAEWLKEQGYKIVDLNWKTKFCEIDIVAEKGKTIHFIEVKYRKNTNQGDGLEYITPKKLKQMNFAAELWLSANKWSGECLLVAISASPTDFKLVEI